MDWRQAVLTDDGLTHRDLRPLYRFRMELLGPDGLPLEEALRGGEPFLTARSGERYSVRLTNPLPVRVAVELTVDGLDSITGKPSGPSDGAKWILEPYGTLTVPGWQVDSGEARRFFFTDKPRSYAKWRGNQVHGDLSANCGVVGAAFFWDQGELDAYADSHPLDERTRKPWTCLDRDLGESNSLACAGAPAKKAGPQAPRAQEAGTGMGEREWNPTEPVDFHYDRGMYQAVQAVVIYYDFAPSTRPNPFPGMDYAPEMP